MFANFGMDFNHELETSIWILMSMSSMHLWAIVTSGENIITHKMSRWQLKKTKEI